MIDGNPHEFLEQLSSCQNTIFIYNGCKYWFQGYMPERGKVHMELYEHEPPSEGVVWEYDGAAIDEGIEDFIKAPIFNKKTFWEVEEDIQWVDD